MELLLEMRYFLLQVSQPQVIYNAQYIESMCKFYNANIIVRGVHPPAAMTQTSPFLAVVGKFVRTIYIYFSKKVDDLFVLPPEISMTQHASSRHRMDAPDRCKRAKLFPSNVSLYVGPDRYRPTIGLMQGSRLQSNVNQQQNVDWNRDELYTNCICHYH